jgi:hypothetical protein
MSSTDGHREEAAMRFFRERLVPTALLLRARHASLLTDGPDPEMATYYDTRPLGEAYVFDLDIPLADTLRDLWSEHPELAALADELSRLARDLRQKEESGEVSPFIYAMF